VARDRQRSKQRQADRRAERLRERGIDDRPAPAEDGDVAREPLADDPGAAARLAASAPPEDTGRSDTVLESPPPPPDTGADDELATDGDAGDTRVATDERRLERAEDERAHKRGRVAAFLVAVWAELQRVQWPDRKTLTTLTGVVLGFVVIAGSYLGLLDAIFSRLVQSIL